MISESLIDLGKMPFELETQPQSKPNIGLIVLASDSTLQREFTTIVKPTNADVFCTRIFNDAEITPETLEAMKGRLPACADVFPLGVGVDVIAYGCTSATMVIGEQSVADLVRSKRPSCIVTNPVTAMRAAFNHLERSRIGLLTPYSPTVNKRMVDKFCSLGLDVRLVGSFNEPDDNRVARIRPSDVLRSVVEIGRHPQCDAVFISCTTVRTLEVLEEAEHEINKPVTSSNHALAWHTLNAVDALVGCKRPEALFRVT